MPLRLPWDEGHPESLPCLVDHGGRFFFLAGVPSPAMLARAIALCLAGGSRATRVPRPAPGVRIRHAQHVRRGLFVVTNYNSRAAPLPDFGAAASCILGDFASPGQSLLSPAGIAIVWAPELC
jgi:hypothetical protein